MRFEKEISLDAPVDVVFGLVEDIQTLATCIPGLEELTIHDERNFDSRVRLSVGPITARFNLRTSIEELVPGRRITLVTTGKDASLAGSVRQRQEFDLVATDANRTTVRIATEIQVQGRLATFGQRVIGARADQFAEEVAANVARLLAERREDRVSP